MSEDNATIQDLTAQAQKSMAKEAAAALPKEGKSKPSPANARDDATGEAPKGGKNPGAKSTGKGKKGKGKGKPGDDLWSDGTLNHKKEKNDKLPHTIMSLFWRYQEDDAGRKIKISLKQRWDRGAAVGRFYSDRLKKYLADKQVKSERHEIYQADEKNRLEDSKMDYFPKDADGNLIPLDVNLKELAEKAQKEAAAAEAAPPQAQNQTDAGKLQGAQTPSAKQETSVSEAEAPVVTPEAPVPAQTPHDGAVPPAAAAQPEPTAKAPDVSEAKSSPEAAFGAPQRPAEEATTAQMTVTPAPTVALSEALPAPKAEVQRREALTERVHERAQEKFDREQATAPAHTVSRKSEDQVEM